MIYLSSKLITSSVDLIVIKNTTFIQQLAPLYFQCNNLINRLTRDRWGSWIRSRLHNWRFLRTLFALYWLRCISSSTLGIVIPAPYIPHDYNLRLSSLTSQYVFNSPETEAGSIRHFLYVTTSKHIQIDTPALGQTRWHWVFCNYHSSLRHYSLGIGMNDSVSRREYFSWAIRLRRKCQESTPRVNDGGMEEYFSFETEGFSFPSNWGRREDSGFWGSHLVAFCGSGVPKWDLGFTGKISAASSVFN